MLNYCGGWGKHACWFLGQMSKYMVNGVNGCRGREKHVCSVGALSAKPGKVADEGRPLLGMAEDVFLDPRRKHRGHVIMWNDYLANEP